MLTDANLVLQKKKTILYLMFFSPTLTQATVRKINTWAALEQLLPIEKFELLP